MFTTLAAFVAEPRWLASPLAWRELLCAVSLFNVMAWAASAASIRRHHSALSPALRSLLRWQLLLSAGYVLGCAYRSAFPVYDIQRLCMVDSWASSVIVGRSVATVAELCLAAQSALLLHAMARAAGSTAVAIVSRLVVPLIAVAELCSWYSVLTTSNLGHVFEESLWGLSAALLLGGLVWLRPRWLRELQGVLAGVCVLLLGYVVYMFEVDVPMYWSRWTAATEQGRHYLGLARGIADASSRWVVSHQWDDWRSEVIWMSLYFSVGVWLSIGLVHLSARCLAGRAGTEPAASRRSRAAAPFSLQ
ncbi:MAG TPA: hypothetical protein VGM74_10180 [Burkholderiaceae bacterium]|jgi:hypothetical protein